LQSFIIIYYHGPKANVKGIFQLRFLALSPPIYVCGFLLI